MSSWEKAIPAADGKLVLIGYRFGPGELVWPDVRNFVDQSWDLEERTVVIDHLRRGHRVRQSLGLSMCRICSCLNGSDEATDLNYCWPAGLAHYLEMHQVSLPSRFIEHVLKGSGPHPQVTEKALDKEGEPEVDETWWKGIANAYRGKRVEEGYLSAFLEIMRQD